MLISDFIKQLKAEDLTKQQKKTLKGQALSGDIEGAERGLKKLKRRGNNGE